VVAPVFSGELLIGWVANIAHHSDVGGKVRVNLRDASSIFQEGIKIPLIKVCDKDIVCEDVVDFIMVNSRVPGERYGDLQAQLASNRVGARRLLEPMAVMEEFDRHHG
jgi:N-methylhydantoinase B